MRHPTRHCHFSVCLLATSLIVTPAAFPLETPPATAPVVAPITAAHPAVAPAAPAVSTVESAVVKVFATVRYPDLGRPWTKQPPQEVTGSGVVIEGKRILTNAHVVSYASQVQVQANQAGDKISATVESIAPGIDLAVLKLDDASFFDAHPALPRASALPAIKDSVMVYGFPTGGTSLSITKGIVSRIEFTLYNFPVSGLRIQIDAAINAGNSGGPAVVGDKMIGLAFSRLGGGAENIGYIIPGEEIELFLADIADGHYDGKPAMFDELQTLENPALRTFLKLDKTPEGKTVEGIVVHRPYPDDPSYPLREWDVITRIGATPVDDQGMIKLGDNLRVRLAYFIQKIATHGEVPLTIVRAGKEIAVKLPVSPDRPLVIPDLRGAYPPYFVYGPLVFSVASQQYVSAIGANANVVNMLGALGSPLVTRRGDKPVFEGEELVIVSSPFFPHKLSKGYGPPVGRVVKTINGTAIQNLNHLVRVLHESKDEFITIEFCGRDAEALVFPRKEAADATEDILNDNGIRSQGSPDAMKVWSAQP